MNKKTFNTLLFTVFFTFVTNSKMLTQKKTIETRYEIKKGNIFIDLSLSNGKHYETYIDLKHNATLLANVSLPQPLSSLDELYIVRETAKVLVNKVNIDLNLENNVIPMNIYTLPKFVLNVVSSNCLSLRYKYNDESFSFIHQLKINNFIDKKQFTIIPSSYRQNGKIIFGELPYDYVSNLYSHSVPVIQSKEQWGINLNYVYIKTNKSDKYVYTNTNYTYLQSKEQYIRAPQNFMNLFSSYLSAHYNEFHCIYVKGRFNCHCDSILKLFNSIHFVINEKDFSIPIDKFYEREQYPFNLGPTGYCSLLLSPSDTDEWILGTSFLNNYITNFDIDNSAVTFYSKNEFNSYTPKRVIISINQCVIMIAIMMIIVLIGIKYSLSLNKTKKKNKQNLLLLL